MILLQIGPAPDGSPPWAYSARCPYHEAARAQVQAIPGLRWHRGGRCYVGGGDAVTELADTLEGAQIARVSGREWLQRPLPLEAPAPATSGLHAYQQVGAQWLAATLQASGAALLADEMGVGKSAQAITAAGLVGAQAPLVVCPAVVVPHWRAQVARWGAFGPPPGAWRVLSYEGFQAAAKAPREPKAPAPARKRPPTARQLEEAARKAPLGAHDLLILDEIHYLSNSRAARSKAVARYRAAHQVPTIGLSGTPMTARPRDLWHVLDTLWPGRFGSWWTFTKRYCDGRFVEIQGVEQAVWQADGLSRAPELARRLAWCSLRRTKADVAIELPPRTRVMLEVEIAAAARKDLARAAAAIGDAKGVSALLSNIEGYKVAAAQAQAAEVLAAGGRCLLLTTRRGTAEALGAALGAPYVHGDTPAALRHSVIADAPCAVATMFSVTTGIDLVGFDHVIMCGLDWVPSTLLQAEARVHRIGQDRPVTIYYLIGRGTLDEVVREKVLERLGQEASLLGAGSDGLAADLSGGDEDELLAAIVAEIARSAK